MGEGKEKEEEHIGRLTFDRVWQSEIKIASGTPLWSEMWSVRDLVGLGEGDSRLLRDGLMREGECLAVWWKGKPQVHLLLEEVRKHEINHPISPNLAGIVFLGISRPFSVLSWVLTSVGYLSLEQWVLALCWLRCIARETCLHLFSSALLFTRSLTRILLSDAVPS